MTATMTNRLQSSVVTALSLINIFIYYVYIYDMTFRKSKLSLIAIVFVIIVISVIAVYKYRKTVTYYMPMKLSQPLPVSTKSVRVSNDAPTVLPDAPSEPEPKPEPVAPPVDDDALFVVPNTSIGVSTRDGRVKNIDIRGTPPVALTDQAPIWNISPNRLPIQSNGI
jgi:hypothetical protein